MEKWIEIFKGGKQVDMDGREHDGDAVIDKALHNFNQGIHRPPAVVGHPEHDSPAWGWVKGLRRVVKNGVKFLEAQFEKLDPAFVEAVKEGRYPERSASFYADGALRHVGFLGGMPPAVKGLAPVEFKDDGEAMVFQFSETQPAPDGDDPDGDDKTKEKEMKFTQEELDAKVAEAVAAKDAELTAAKEKAAASEARFAEAEKAKRKAGIKSYMEGLVKEGKILPGEKARLTAFMEGLDAAGEGTINFAEGDETKTETMVETFKNFLEARAAHPLFKDMTPPAGDRPGAEFAEGEDFTGLTDHV